MYFSVFYLFPTTIKSEYQSHSELENRQNFILLLCQSVRNDFRIVMPQCSDSGVNECRTRDLRDFFELTDIQPLLVALPESKMKESRNNFRQIWCM